MAESKITVETLDAKQTDRTPVAETPIEEKYVRARAPGYYWEVLSLIPPRLMRCPATHSFVNVEFFLDTIEAYLPALRESIAEHCSLSCDGNRLIAVRMGTVNCMRHIIGDLRAILNLCHCSAPESIVAGYRDLIKEFEQAHGEEFYQDWTESFAQDFKAWKRGA